MLGTNRGRTNNVMKIALINPNINGEYPQPPLGLLSVAASCIQHGDDVMLIDANAHKLSSKKIIEQIECVDMVGITATSLSYPAALVLAKDIKSEYHKALILGGIHATLFSEEIIKDGIFDIVVAGECENIMPVLIELRRKGIYDGHHVIDLDTIPPLPYHLLDGFRPQIAYGKHQPFMPILTARGCPFKCSFCSNPVFGKKYRARSIDNISAEVERLHYWYGINEIKFYDDVFTMDKQRTIAFSKEMKRVSKFADKPIAWSCMTRVNLVEQEVLGYMKRGGCYSIAYGLESGDPDILKSISKNTTLEQAEQAVRYTKEASINVIGYFMLGAPSETLKTIDKTVDFAIALGLDHAQFSIATALPGSELYNYVPEALRANSYALPHDNNPSLCELSPAQLREAQKNAYKRFKRKK